MLTSKQRSILRSDANTLETTLMVGKGGVTESVISEAATQLEARELVKGRVLESALMSAREVSDAICEALNADGVQCVGSKFVIYKKSQKKAQEEAAEEAKKAAEEARAATEALKQAELEKAAEEAKKAAEEAKKAAEQAKNSESQNSASGNSSTATP